MAAGRKHLLLVYNRPLSRLWPGTLALGLGFFALWWYGEAFTSLYRPELGPLVLAAAGYTTSFGLFALAARRMGYVRAFDDYFLVASPFFRFKTGYNRVLGVRSADFQRLFDVERLSWAEERTVAPLIGSTAVVVKLGTYPISTSWIRLFLSKYMLSPKDRELVLVVPDWMALSVEIDSRYNEFRRRRSGRKPPPGFQRGLSG